MSGPPPLPPGRVSQRRRAGTAARKAAVSRTVQPRSPPPSSSDDEDDGPPPSLPPGRVSRRRAARSPSPPPQLPSAAAKSSSDEDDCPPPSPPRGRVSSRRAARSPSPPPQPSSAAAESSSDEDDCPPPSPPRGRVSSRRAARSPSPRRFASAAAESSSGGDSTVPPLPPRQRARAVTSPGRTASPQRSIIAGQPEARRTFVVSLRQDAQGRHGVELDTTTPRASGRRPVIVTAIVSGSSAAQAGVLPGDELLAVAGYGVEAGGLRQALAHLRDEEQRLQRQRGEDVVDVDWRFYRPAGPMPQLPRTKSPVRFSPARVRTFTLSPTEEQEKRKHWHAIHGASGQQYAQQALEERNQQHTVESKFRILPPLPTGTSIEELYTSAAIIVQKHVRGQQERGRLKRQWAQEVSQARGDTNTDQLEPQNIEEMVAEIYGLCDPDLDGWIGYKEYIYYLQGIQEWGKGQYTPENYDQQWLKECTQMGCDPARGITIDAFKDILQVLCPNSTDNSSQSLYGQFRTDPDVIKEDLDYFREHHAVIVVQKYVRGRQARVRFDGDETRKARERASCTVQAARRGQLARRQAREVSQARVEQMVAEIYGFCDPDLDGWIGREEYIYYLQGIQEWGKGQYTPENYDQQWLKECTQMGCDPARGITIDAFKDILYGQFRTDPDVIKEDLDYFREHQTFIEDYERDEAATRLQTNWRGHMARKLAAKAIEDKIAADLERDQSATKLQANWRGHVARKQAAKAMIEDEIAAELERNQAATKLQANWRAHMARTQAAQAIEDEIAALEKLHELKQREYDAVKLARAYDTGRALEAHARTNSIANIKLAQAAVVRTGSLELLPEPEPEPEPEPKSEPLPVALMGSEMPPPSPAALMDSEMPPPLPAALMDSEMPPPLPVALMMSLPTSAKATASQTQELAEATHTRQHWQSGERSPEKVTEEHLVAPVASTSRGDAAKSDDKFRLPSSIASSLVPASPASSASSVADRVGTGTIAQSSAISPSRIPRLSHDITSRSPGRTARSSSPNIRPTTPSRLPVRRGSRAKSDAEAIRARLAAAGHESFASVHKDNSPAVRQTEADSRQARNQTSNQVIASLRASTAAGESRPSVGPTLTLQRPQTAREKAKARRLKKDQLKAVAINNVAAQYTSAAKNENSQPQTQEVAAGTGAAAAELLLSPRTDEMHGDDEEPPRLKSLPWQLLKDSSEYHHHDFTSLTGSGIQAPYDGNPHRDSFQSVAAEKQNAEEAPYPGLAAGLHAYGDSPPNPLGVLQPSQDYFDLLFSEGLQELCTALPGTDVWAEIDACGLSPIAAPGETGKRVEWKALMLELNDTARSEFAAQWLRRGSEKAGTLSAKKATLLVTDAVEWLHANAAKYLKDAITAPFETFLSRAERMIQDRTGAEEASVRLDDIQAVKEAHDQVQATVSLALDHTIDAIPVREVSAAIRGQLPEGQAMRERFVDMLLAGMIAVFNPRRVLDRTRAVLALPPWYPSASAKDVSADAVPETASGSGADSSTARGLSGSTAATRVYHEASRKKPVPSVPKPKPEPKAEPNPNPKRSAMITKHGTPGYARPRATDSARASRRSGVKTAGSPVVDSDRGRNNGLTARPQRWTPQRGAPPPAVRGGGAGGHRGHGSSKHNKPVRQEWQR